MNCATCHIYFRKDFTGKKSLNVDIFCKIFFVFSSDKNKTVRIRIDPTGFKNETAKNNNSLSDIFGAIILDFAKSSFIICSKKNYKVFVLSFRDSK